MEMPMLSLMIALVQNPADLPDGRRLAEGDACYTLNMNHGGTVRPIGATWQTVKRALRDHHPVLEIVVHQSVNNGAFDMRDEFVLDAASLRPLALTNYRKGELHVRLAYADDRVTGERFNADGTATPIDVPLPVPVWEGNLFGLTFAALPLAEGATFSLPYWQYDKGFGGFTVEVTGSRTVETASGLIDAWIVGAVAGDGPTMTYLISKADHRELSYSAAQGSQSAGGDCSAISAPQ
jgi:hypothetical protein